jgi:prepilin-type N-terminal cleavage/methylation domain-containing protein
MNKLTLNNRGFTMVEILVSMVIAGTIISALSGIVTTYVSLSQSGLYLNLANSFAEAQIEGLRNSGYNNLSAGTTSLTAQLSSKLPLSKAASMIITAPIAGIKQVDLSITYADRGNTITNTYRTYVGELGVGQ